MNQAKNVAVIGAGVMGRGVAQNFAEKGFCVLLVDLRDEILQNAIESMERSLRMERMFSKENLPGAQEVLSHITTTTEYRDVADADFVIENIPEKIALKKEVYQKLDSICSETCIFGVNTSCIPITEIASFTRRPDRMIGIHFMNPVPMKTHVEVIKGFYTSAETLDTTRKWLKAIGKEVTVVNDSPGFVANRISHLFMNEAAFVVQDQVASPQEVDTIFKKCYGHKMGPLETADLIGLDTVVDSLGVLYESFQDPKFRCCPLLRKMVCAGLLGRKSGKGFYDYA